MNGVSSSGKSTVAKELAKILPDYFHVSIDDYDYLIEKMEDREKGKLIPIETDILFHRQLRILSDFGVNLIVDTVIANEMVLEDFQKTFIDYPVIFVAVHCPVEILNRREKVRSDRLIGQAAKQLNFVHQNIQYNLEIDTHKHSLEFNTKLIYEFIQSLPSN
ncbi:MAG TPA: AAA family ATPase, partial [Anaerolineaceae bacterium]|nr:AAA family ATPase [Anaerolineaceae bacterium]